MIDIPQQLSCIHPLWVGCTFFFVTRIPMELGSFFLKVPNLDVKKTPKSAEMCGESMLENLVREEGIYWDVDLENWNASFLNFMFEGLSRSVVMVTQYVGLQLSCNSWHSSRTEQCSRHTRTWIYIIYICIMYGSFSRMIIYELMWICYFSPPCFNPFHCHHSTLGHRPGAKRVAIASEAAS